MERNQTIDAIRGIAAVGMLTSHILVSLPGHVPEYLDTYFMNWPHYMFGLMFGYFWRPGRARSYSLWLAAIISTLCGMVLWDAPVSWLLLLACVSVNYPGRWYLWIPAGMVYPFILQAAVCVFVGSFLRHKLHILPDYPVPAKDVLSFLGRNSIKVYVYHLAILSLIAFFFDHFPVLY